MRTLRGGQFLAQLTGYVVDSKGNQLAAPAISGDFDIVLAAHLQQGLHQTNRSLQLSGITALCADCGICCGQQGNESGEPPQLAVNLMACSLRTWRTANIRKFLLLSSQDRSTLCR